MSDKTPLPLPPSTPRVHGRFTRWLGRNLLRLCGWKVAGELPDQKKLIFIIAPHTSNWDFVWGLLAKWALDLRVRVFDRRWRWRSNTLTRDFISAAWRRGDYCS